MINRNFSLIWISQALSDVASEMTSLALPLAVLAATRSPVDASLVATVVGIAHLVAKLPSGLIADTYDRRRLMLLCDACRAALALLLAAAIATGHLTTVVAVGSAAATALFSSVFGPAESGVLRQSVPPEHRREAVTRNVVRSNAAIAVGPPLGGILLAAGAPLAFVIDGLTFLLSLLLVSRVVYEHVPRPRATGPGTHPLRNTATELTLGFGWVFRRSGLVVLIAIAAYVNLLGRAIELLVAFSASDEGTRPVAAGLVLTAAGIGGIAGGLCTGWVLRRLSATAIMAGVSAAWLVLMPIASSGNVWISTFAVGLVVFTLPSIGSLAALTIMAEAPTHLQGRVVGAVTLLAISIAWAGPGLTGFLIAAAGPLTASLVLAAPMAVPLLAVLGSARVRAALTTLGTSVSSSAAPAPAPAPAAAAPEPVAEPVPATVPVAARVEEDVMAHSFEAETDARGSADGLLPTLAVGPFTPLGWGRPKPWL